MVYLIFLNTHRILLGGLNRSLPIEIQFRFLTVSMTVNFPKVKNMAIL